MPKKCNRKEKNTEPSGISADLLRRLEEKGGNAWLAKVLKKYDADEGPSKQGRRYPQRGLKKPRRYTDSLSSSPEKLPRRRRRAQTPDWSSSSEEEGRQDRQNPRKHRGPSPKDRQRPTPQDRPQPTPAPTEEQQVPHVPGQESPARPGPSGGDQSGDDFSRVKLVSMNEDEGADYINANYMPGYNSPQEYIATQGPLPETRNDFWKMVLQQKSKIVIMLTQCNEKRRVKCDHYWPFTADPVAYGDITLEMISEDEQADWAFRVFRLSYADDVQDVMHFNYTAWPDHGVPTTNAAESILHFVHMIRQQATKIKGPITVHCSAGVGRTGTFIALDRLMQHIRDHEFVDILGLVGELRSYRISMVQTEEQYVFIHQCVQLMWKKKKQQFCISDVIYENVNKS